MRQISILRTASAALLTTATLMGAAFAGTVAASANETAVKARRGYYQIVLFHFGPISAMAKGEMDYDADVAKKNAEQLKAIASYVPADLFPAGTSNEDMPGKTRSLPAIWSDTPGFVEAYTTWKSAVDNLAAVAGNGRGEMAAAFGQVGKACGACHDDYRAKDF